MTTPDLFTLPERVPFVRHSQTSKTDVIYRALIRGENLSVGHALSVYGVYALSQECGRVEKKYGVVLERGWLKTSPGVKVRTYWMNKETIAKQNEAKN